ncbi:hypothetical protein B0H16DRAFT_1449259 [Mycena metata]|uniref:Uncharacterized protein n=1 Tax=Mycena metata TaxID=1033252 RepID=A0AAD7K4S4_9AGAR|nr:hypothetical protein B0H16DRAFT_1449259 [Mycena metata]
MDEWPHWDALLLPSLWAQFESVWGDQKGKLCVFTGSIVFGDIDHCVHNLGRKDYRYITPHTLQRIILCFQQCSQVATRQSRRDEFNIAPAANIFFDLCDQGRWKHILINTTTPASEKISQPAPPRFSTINSNPAPAAEKFCHLPSTSTHQGTRGEEENRPSSVNNPPAMDAGASGRQNLTISVSTHSACSGKKFQGLRNTRQPHRTQPQGARGEEKNAGLKR